MDEDSNLTEPDKYCLNNDGAESHTMKVDSEKEDDDAGLKRFNS